MLVPLPPTPHPPAPHPHPYPHPPTPPPPLMLSYWLYASIFRTTRVCLLCDICVLIIHEVATVYAWSITPRVPVHERGNTTYSVFICFHMQSYDYHQLCHCFNISCTVAKILGQAKWWLWRKFIQITRESKYFPFNILIDTVTIDTIYRSNLKNRFSIYIAYRHAALERV